MKRYAIICLFLCLSMHLLVAQNNPYEIDDACYPLLEEADALIGRNGFDQANARLLEMAIVKGDARAQSFYYVERLKDLIARLGTTSPSTSEQDALVLRYMEDLQDMSLKLGLRQFYYYAYDLAQAHFYNHGKVVSTMELIQEMQQKAERERDDYGRWMAARYMVSIYVSQNDYISAKKHILEALRIYNSTREESVRRQAVARLYCDLADTYPIGHDSVGVNLRKAW